MKKKFLFLLPALLLSGSLSKAIFDDTYSPLHKFASRDAFQLAKEHIAAGADVNAKASSNLTPLHLATTAEMADLLIKSGANINAKSGRTTPLMHAAYFGHADVLKRLLENGADIHPRDYNGRTALHNAIDGDEFNAPEIVDELIAAGSNVNNINNWGETILDTLYKHKDSYEPDTYNQLLSHLKKAGAKHQVYSVE